MILVGTKYKNATLADHYDAIVIGSGMSGLASAAMLSKAGRKVLVLERHYTAGGFTHSYLRKGFEWDVGVHYIGQVHNKFSPMRQAFDFVSDGQLDWASMGEVYDSIVVGDERYDFRAGRGRFREDMIARFPGEKAAIDGYLRKLDIVNNVTMPGFVAKKMAPGFLSGPLNALTDGVLTNYFQKSTLSVLSELTSNKELIGVLTGQWGDYGTPPAASAFGMHALVAHHYMEGGAFPVGGASNIARTIEPVIQKSGGQVITEAEVEEILVSKNRAYGVRLADGRTITAPEIISAAGFHNTCMKMLPADLRRKYGFDQKAGKVKSSLGHLGLYIGLNADGATLNLPKNNFWLYPGYDHDANMAAFGTPDADFPVVYISFPSSKDPSWAARYPGRSTIEVVVPAPYAWFEQWEDTPWRKRGQDYDDFKAGLSERLLEYVYRHVPQARGQIAYHELSTPLSTRHFSNYSRGELYGLEHTPDRFAQDWLRPKTPVDGLYMTGQDTLCCGVGSALFTGLMTGSLVLGPKSLAVLPSLLRWPGSSATAAPGVTGKAPRGQRKQAETVPAETREPAEKQEAKVPAAVG